MRQALIVGGPHQITEQPNDIIGDGRDRETLHRGLQPELQPRARVHRFQEFLVLLLQFDVDAGAQQIGGARQLQRKTRLPILDGDAGAQRRFHSPRQERGPGWQPTNLALADGLQSLLDVSS